MKGITRVVLILLSFTLVLGFLSSVAHSGENLVIADSLNVIKKSSDETTIANPDECEKPASKAGPIPIPYPNTGKAADTSQGSKKVKTDGTPIQVEDSEFQKTEGDEPGADRSR